MNKISEEPLKLGSRNFADSIGPRVKELIDFYAFFFFLMGYSPFLNIRILYRNNLMNKVSEERLS